MNTLLKISASFFLLFNGIGALFGGWNLITYPDGSGLQMPLKYLQFTPFHDYFIPGLVLFAANGLFSIFVFAALIFKFRNYARLMMVQGAVLLGWIVIQLLLIRTFHFFQLVFGLVGIALLVIGRLYEKTTDEAHHIPHR